MSSSEEDSPIRFLGFLTLLPNTGEFYFCNVFEIYNKFTIYIAYSLFSLRSFIPFIFLILKLFVESHLKRLRVVRESLLEKFFIRSSLVL